MRYGLALILATLTIPASAQEERPSMPPGPSYPSFVGTITTDDVQATPPTEPEGEQPSSTEETEEEVILDFLVGDIDELTAWNRLRGALEPAIDEIKLMAESGSSWAAIDRMDRRLDKIMGELAAQSRFQAPNQELTIVDGLRRVRRLVDIALEEHEEGRLRHASSAWELTRRNIGALQEAFTRSDYERDPDYVEVPYIPRDWDLRRRSLDQFAYSLLGLSAVQLVESYDERIRILGSDRRRKFTKADIQLAEEMSEIARELVERGFEVSSTSRGAFRDHALRLDVLADNLRDYLATDNFLYARRHLLVMQRAIADIDHFFEAPAIDVSTMP